jgi:hypothetical protein
MTLQPKPKMVGMDQGRRRIGLLGFALSSVLMFSGSAAALPGTHPAAISTFDTRASSVVLAYRRGFIGGGGFNHISYNANFTNTSGVLSSQFGIHYVNFKKGENDPATNGVGGGAVGLINIPATRRLDNGLPIVGIAPYFGILPTALISGEKNYLSLPFIIGFSVPWSPIEALTITPWYELAISADLDTVVKSAAFADTDICEFVICDDNGIPVPDQEIEFDSDTVAKVLDRGVDVDLTVAVPMRFGVDAAIHLGDTSDLTLYGGMVSIGGGFSGTKAGVFGASLVWRWDDIVPAVLPPERRLERENCDDIEARFRTCPASKNWKSPEQLEPTAPSPAPVPTDQPSPSEPAPMEPQPGTVDPYGSSTAPPPPAPPASPTPPAAAEPPAPPTAGFPE